VAREPFGSLEQIADGIWALVSTPLTGDRTTLSKGGIVAGTTGVLAIEGFNQPRGAEWLAGKARELAGRWPTHVVVTHYHADHANGVAGYRTSDARPVVCSTERTRALVLERNQPADPARVAALQDAQLIDGTRPSQVDLGGRVVRIVPRGGHTESDVTLEIDDPSVVFCGDLFWNGMFPNYVDARPMQLGETVRAIRRRAATVYVPGHGSGGKEPEYDRYVAMLGEVERAARSARERGMTAVEGAAQFALPPALGEWLLFNKVFFERAFAAWYREISS
jgi:glyoxylase-like metal-dependent hydrolase (beta-lactamase superfamily II)